METDTGTEGALVDSPEAEVVVIGSGPSGAVVSHTLAQAGVDVLCLEQGDWVNPSDYSANHRMWELVARRHWATEPNHRHNAADYRLVNDHTDLTPSMFNGVGGSSIHFGGLWPRLVPSDFRVKSQDGVADDWPISYEDLVPHYDETDRVLGVSGLDDDPAYPSGLSYSQPPVALGKAGVSAAEACNKLGWHWWPGAHAIPTFRHGELAACQRWGTCVQGCPEGAKASFDIAYWPAAIRAGARLETGARVTRIETDEISGEIRGVRFVGISGEPQTIRTKYVVMCANGIGTPRLLLASASPAHPNGLANSSDMVGRNLMLHPCAMVLGYYEEDLETWRGPLGSPVVTMQFYETDRGRGFLRGMKVGASTAPGIIMGGIDPHRELGFDNLWGPAFHEVIDRSLSVVMWSGQVDDLPDPHNRIVLSETESDAAGLPLPEVHYRYGENTQKLRQFSIDRMREAHQAAGAVKTIEFSEMPGEPGHLLGTARMGNDRDSSVVDSYGRAHDVAGLRIADGSLFVTGGSVNPTSTICALARRVSTQLAQDVLSGRVST